MLTHSDPYPEDGPALQVRRGGPFDDQGGVWEGTVTMTRPAHPISNLAQKARPRDKGYMATRILLQAGFSAVNIGGGYKTCNLFQPKGI